MNHPVEASCACCGGRFSTTDMVPYNAAWICAGCKPAFFQRLQQGDPVSGYQDYAGFWIRALAKFLDGLVVSIVMSPLLIWYFMSIFQQMRHGMREMGTSANAVAWLFQLGCMAVSMGYNVWFLGRFGATPGKMACKLRVIRPGGQSISYTQALGRTLAELISGMICDIGYLMAAFDDEKRSLHDRMASTRVIRNG